MATDWPPPLYNPERDPSPYVLFPMVHTSRPELWVYGVLEVKIQGGGPGPYNARNRPLQSDATHARCLACHISFPIRRTATGNMDCSEYLTHVETTHRNAMRDFLNANRGRRGRRRRNNQFVNQRRLAQAPVPACNLPVQALANDLPVLAPANKSPISALANDSPALKFPPVLQAVLPINHEPAQMLPPPERCATPSPDEISAALVDVKAILEAGQGQAEAAVELARSTERSFETVAGLLAALIEAIQHPRGVQSAQL